MTEEEYDEVVEKTKEKIDDFLKAFRATLISNREISLGNAREAADKTDVIIREVFSQFNEATKIYKEENDLNKLSPQKVANALSLAGINIIDRLTNNQELQDSDTKKIRQAINEIDLRPLT